MEKIYRETNGKLRITKLKRTSSYHHIHEAIELKYIKKGEITAGCNGKEYNLKDGAFFIVFPNQVHYYSAVETPENEFYTIIVSPEFVGRYYRIFASSQPTSPVCYPNDPFLDELVDLAYRMKVAEASTDVLDGLLISILGQLIPHYTFAAPTYPQDRISRIIAYCNEHYKDDITSVKLADELYISRSHISNFFNKTLGITFRDYINSLRIAEALSLINREHISISEAATRAGFSTVRTFNDAFKKKYEKTPTEYIDRNKKALRN